MEDSSRLKADLAEFDRVKPKLEKKDINQYKTLAELYKALEPFAEKEVTSNKQQDKAKKEAFFKNNEAKIFYKDPQITVIIPHTEEASCYFGKGTKWCTAVTKSDNMFDSYNGQGPLYIIYTKDGNKFQFHFTFEEDQFMDAQDQEVDLIELVKKYPSLKKAFNKLGIKHLVLALVDNPPEEMQLAAVRDYDLALKYIENPSEDVQLAAVNYSGYAIENIKNPSLKVQLVAVKQNGYVLYHIKNPSEKVKLAAVKQQGDVIQFIDNPSEEVQLAAVNNVGHAIRFIENPSEKVQLAAVNRDSDAINYIKNPTEKVKQAAKRS